MKLYVKYEQWGNTMLYSENDPDLDLNTKQNSTEIEVDDEKGENWLSIQKEFYTFQKQIDFFYFQNQREKNEL